jgi:hypothetical protein
MGMAIEASGDDSLNIPNALCHMVVLKERMSAGYIWHGNMP